MNKVQKYALALQIFAIFVGVNLFAALLWGWILDVEWFSLNCGYSTNTGCGIDLKSGTKEILSFAQRFFGLIVQGTAFAIACVGIVTFINLMQRFKQGEFFSVESIGLLSRLSKIVLCWALYSPIRMALLSVVATFHRGVGHRVVVFDVGMSDLFNILIFISFVLITSLMKEGLNLQKEKDLTI